MTAAEARKMLARMLAQQGRPVTLQRVTDGAVGASVSVLGWVRPAEAAALADTVVLPSAVIVVGVDEMLAAHWPAVGADPLPRRDDRLIDGGRTWVVDAVADRRIGADIVRLDLTVTAG